MRRIATLLALGALMAVGTLGAPAEALAQGYGGTTHVVRSGDTLYGIAWYYGVDASALAAANGIYNPDWIYAGQRLTIPGSHKPGPAPGPGHEPGRGAPHSSGGSAHVVQAGDTLYSIAWRYGTTITALMDRNGLSNPDYIAIGQRLVIPGSYTPPHVPDHKGCGYSHVVKRGETLSGIAWSTGTTVYAIARANGIGYPYTIYSGQSLHIPCDAGSPPPKHDPPSHRPPSRPPAKATARPPLRPAACHRTVQIVEPLNHARISGTLHVIGTASIQNFQFYKLEYAMGHSPVGSDFRSINDVYTTPVNDSILGVWYTGNMPDGDYTLRLTAVDHAGQFEQPCDVRIRLDN